MRYSGRWRTRGVPSSSYFEQTNIIYSALIQRLCSDPTPAPDHSGRPRARHHTSVAGRGCAPKAAAAGERHRAPCPCSSPPPSPPHLLRLLMPLAPNYRTCEWSKMQRRRARHGPSSITPTPKSGSEQTVRPAAPRRLSDVPPFRPQFGSRPSYPAQLASSPCSLVLLPHISLRRQAFTLASSRSTRPCAQLRLHTLKAMQVQTQRRATPFTSHSLR